MIRISAIGVEDERGTQSISLDNVPTVYQVLPELEQFSTGKGGSLSKIVANRMRFDESIVVAPSADDGAWGVANNRIIVIPSLLTYGKIKGRRFIPRSIKGLFFRRVYRALLSRLTPGDVVWIHQQPYVAAALEGPIHRAKAKLVYHSHDPYLPKTASSAFKSFKPDAWVFDSDALRQRFLKLFPHWTNTHVIPNGLDEQLFYPAQSTPNDIPVVLYIGRLQAEKGVHILIEAIKILTDRKVQVICKLVGSHFSGEANATAYIKTLHRNSPPNVYFVGYRTPTEVAKELRSADLFCCPSIWLEAFGVVNIEAMACGLPVVASRVGGIPEIASAGGFLLVEPGSATELADAIQKLVIDKQLRMILGAEGLRSFQDNFTWDTILAKCERVLRTIQL